MTSTTSRSEADDDRWFFGKISREEAANHLNNAGGQEGTFLVRESHSSPGNFVLSFITSNGPTDILIWKNWSDSFYSLITDTSTILHGLDTLIMHYTQQPVSGSSGTILTVPCVGDPPPPETRLHGSSNLLHRAVAQANTKVVSELLKSGYRKIDAKNNMGQTALHIACINGDEELVRLLLKANANVDVRDQEKLTPLQHACRQDFASIVHLLIKEGGATIQLRTPTTGEVALHEAASCGSLDCVKMLLRHHAPAWPRSTQNRTPAVLAKENNHQDCFNALINHRPTIPLVRLPEYYHGKIRRKESQSRLQNVADSSSEGLFLLRKSSNKESGFVLSLMDKLQPYHFLIQKKGSMFFIDNGPYFRCLETLVDHYSRFCDGLPCRLTSPLAPPLPLEEAEFKNIYLQVATNENIMLKDSLEMEPLLPPCDIIEDRMSDTFYCVSNEDPFNLKLSSKNSSDNLILPTQASNPKVMSVDDPSPSHSAALYPPSPLPSSTPSLNENSPTLPSPLLPSPSTILRRLNNPASPVSNSMTMKGNKTEEILGDIDSSSLSVGAALGVGEFGTVLKGIWVSPSGDQIEVAVKTLHDNDAVTKENFLREAKVMMDLNHPYIVKLLGVCQGPPVAMVQELAVMGSLLNFLLDSPHQIQADFHFKLWAAQVADGMNYLEEMHFVHRDLAARNLLLSSLTLVKISDFGLSRALNTNANYYKATQGGRWPLKWYAPESIYYGQFTHLSDVWSYGVTLWEMYTYGDQPYGELTGHEVADLLEKGQRLPQPKDCPTGTFNLMLRCWHSSPKRRPTFHDLIVIFRGSKDYVNIKPYFRNT